MTKLLAVSVFALFCASYSQAQSALQPTLKGSVIPSFTRDQQRQRRIAVADQNPLRVWNGQLFDLTEVIYGINYGRGVDLGRSPNLWLEGKVISIGKGFVIAAKQNGKVVCLKGHPQQDRLTDGDWVTCAALSAGRFEYETVTGGKSTVPLLEYGVPLAKAGKNFDTVTRFSADGSNSKTVKFDP